MELFGLGAPELLLILFVLLLFFGKDKLPQMARSIGHSFQELKAGFTEGVSENSDKKDSSEKTKKS